MDLKSGLIEINGEIFTPGYTFENFQKSTFFDWGNIKSVYDPKGNVSSINIIYNAGK